ncbi:MAG: ribonuclease Z [Candidatus Zixiibacteriota bacterium]|nr:MAG: ribonuclease Z [candidate division Zixibacteria bacterium]
MNWHTDISHSWQGRRLRVKIPFSRAGVAHHVWIGGGDISVLIDAGDGVLRDLLERDIPPEEIDAVFITHGHFDHMGGVHSLLGFMRMVGRETTLPVYVPAGCREVIECVESFVKCYADTVPFKIDLVELAPNQRVSVCELSVVSYPVVHCGSIVGSEVLDPIPAFGYRITLGDETVAVTGDTGDCESLRALVKDADLAIIEATYLNSHGKDRRLLEAVHLSEDIAGKIGESAKECILVHKARRP